jgi:hypothetical protein
MVMKMVVAMNVESVVMVVVSRKDVAMVRRTKTFRAGQKNVLLPCCMIFT